MRASGRSLGFLYLFFRKEDVCMLNANAKSWVKGKWVNVKREVTIDNKISEQVGEDEVSKHR